MDIKTEIITSDNPCNWGMKYLSVIGHGKAQLIDNATDKINALNIIMNKYATYGSFEYSDKAVNKVPVIKVSITNMTGKNQDEKLIQCFHLLSIEKKLVFIVLTL
jgi:uncharacterized protein